ncbi:MAG TPA: AI-2E family transporter [Sideroxyarcus sp.]|nr:AI-2E family transporter [Sideroxyarcus sp.]
MEKRSEYFARYAAVLILAAGCAVVLLPFITATLLAAVLCISTWPFYLRLLKQFNGRKNVAAFSMTLSLAAVAILPLALLAYNLADNVAALYAVIKPLVENGPPEPPAWLKELPLVGNPLDAYWHRLVTSPNALDALETRLLEPARDYLLAGGMILAQGVMEMSLAAFVCFFLYREGAVLLAFINRAMAQLVGNCTESVLGTIDSTVRGVMFGLLGTALAQGLVATLGFAIAGVPAALLLGALTFLLSLVPVGPPLAWGGAAIWLFSRGEAGWGIFMLLWGSLLISGVDNIVKPWLISRSSHLPFILGVFGVMGGVVAFGFVGIFIGPALLAVGFSLIRDAVARDRLAHRQPLPEVAPVSEEG